MIANLGTECNPVDPAPRHTGHLEPSLPQAVARCSPRQQRTHGQRYFASVTHEAHEASTQHCQYENGALSKRLLRGAHNPSVLVVAALAWQYRDGEGIPIR
jgi:hypothetical protein